MARRGPALVPGRPPGDPEGITPAPGELEQVRAFVNTRDIEAGTDELTSPAALGAWLDARGLASGGQITASDLTLAIELREALRGVLGAHAHASAGPRAAASAGGSDDAATQDATAPEAGALGRIAGGLPVRLQVSPDGAVGLAAGEAAGAGPAALARLLLIASRAATLGTWERLKVCGADDCQWAFYDRSPTRSGCWCSMRICGSRAKSRAYRQRAAATGG
jgi:predicted RNA-binding Zn ribbon-like protein